MSAPANAAADRLFCGIYPCGIVYADRRRTVDGDYARLAFLPYSTLRLEWTGQPMPDDVRAMIELDAASMESKRGKPFEISASGQCVMLGK